MFPNCLRFKYKHMGDIDILCRRILQYEHENATFMSAEVAFSRAWKVSKISPNDNNVAMTNGSGPREIKV